MKTIVQKGTNISLYLFPNSETVVVTDDSISVGNPVELTIGDCNSSNTVLVENVTKPTKWKGGNYLYTESDGWTLNPDWSELEAPIQNPLVGTK